MAQLAERSRFNLLVAGSILIFCARVAQLVEHWSNKPTVAGSIPVVSIYFIHTFESSPANRERKKLYARHTLYEETTSGPPPQY